MTLLAVFGDDCEGPPTFNSGVWEITLMESPEMPLEEGVVDGNLAECILIATTAKKQRVEVQWKTLDHAEKEVCFGRQRQGGAGMD